jgi:hypothetical protein
MKEAPMKTCLWSFIIAVAVADMSFTWANRDTAPDWEANPVVAGMLHTGGVTGAIVYRSLWLGLAAVAARANTRFSWLVTPVWTIGHAYLLAVLIRCCESC